MWKQLPDLFEMMGFLLLVAFFVIGGILLVVIYIGETILGGFRRLARRSDRGERRAAAAAATKNGFVTQVGGWQRPRGPYLHLTRGRVYVPLLQLRRQYPWGRVIQMEYRSPNGLHRGRSNWSLAFLPTPFKAPYTIIQPRPPVVEFPPGKQYQEITMGTGRVEQRWLVAGAQPEFGRWLLSSGPFVQLLMDPGIIASQVTVEVSDAEVLIAVPAWPHRDLERFFWWAVALRDALVAPRSVPVEQTQEAT